MQQPKVYEGGAHFDELSIPVGHWKASDYNQVVYVSGPEPRAVLDKAQEIGCDMDVISLDCVLLPDTIVSSSLLLSESEDGS